MICSDMLNSYTQKNKYLNLPTTSFFYLSEWFWKKIVPNSLICFVGQMNNPSVRISNIFGFWGKNFQNTIILRKTKLDAQICRVPLTCVWLYSCTHKSLPAAGWADWFMVGDKNKFQRLYWMLQRLYWVRAIIEASLAPAKAELRAEAKADQQISQDNIKKQYDEIKATLDEGVKKGYFSKQFAKQMLPVKPKGGTFYLLPKVHKKFDKIPKGRPIISGSGSNTEMISWFCDQVLKEKVKDQDSYMRIPHTFYDILKASMLVGRCHSIPNQSQST